MLLLLTIPVMANVISDTMQNRSGIVYLYSQNCRYCVNFEPIYKQFEQKYNKIYKFKKIDVYSKQGRDLAREYKVYSVPTVLVFNSETKKTAIVVTDCMFDFACLEKEVINFIK